MGFGRKTSSAEAHRAIAIALFIQDPIDLLASFEIQLSVKMGTMGWSNPVLYLLLAFGYAYFILVMPIDV